MPKHLSVYIPDNRDDLAEYVKEKVDANYKGKVSPYLIDLIERDMGQSEGILAMPSEAHSEMFVDLCKMMAGDTAMIRAKKAFEILKDRVSQRAFLEHILKRASIASAWLAKHPEAIYDGLRFQHSNEYSELHTPSPAMPSDISSVI